MPAGGLAAAEAVPVTVAAAPRPRCRGRDRRRGRGAGRRRGRAVRALAVRTPPKSEEAELAELMLPIDPDPTKAPDVRDET